MSSRAVSASANADAAASVGAVSADIATARRLCPAAFPPLLDHHLPPTERFRAND